MAATSPDRHLREFRAPPPSPVGHASNRRQSVVNEDEISEFLQHSLRVPDLILPDQIFPKEVQVRNLPEINLTSLISRESETMANFLESIAAIGCVQLVNHGVSGDLIRAATLAAVGIFGIPPEKKKMVTRLPGRKYGFEELGEEDESEEFVWSRDDALKSAMEGIRAQGFSDFRKMENLSTEIENIAHQVLSTLLQHAPIEFIEGNELEKQELHSLVCCLHKHRQYTSPNTSHGSLKSDFIRMLIKGSADYSHTLCVHVCDHLSEFHVYSKKGWVSFTPSHDAIIITIGDQIQEQSGGHYKNVIGRQIFKVEDEKERVSMAFLYTPSTIVDKSNTGNNEKTISIKQQLVFVLFITLIYNISLYFYNMF